MSRTYEIMCHTCRETLWIGQGWPPNKGEEDRRYIYGTDSDRGLLREFLFKHESKHNEKHELAFWDNEQTEPDSSEYHKLHWANDPEDVCDCPRPECVAKYKARYGETS